MAVWMGGWMDAWMGGCVDGWVDGSVHGWMDGGISRWMSGRSLGFGEGLLGPGPHSPASRVVSSESLHLYAL